MSTSSSASAWRGFLPISIGIHIRAAHALRWELLPQESRGVLHLDGTDSSSVSLFLTREEIARLQDSCTAALHNLDTTTTDTTIINTAAPSAA